MPPIHVGRWRARTARAICGIGSALCLLLLAGCDRSQLETAELQDRPGLVTTGEQQQLWLLTKQEEVRQVGIGGGSTRNSISWRSDTFFHFDVQAFDPIATTLLWKQRLRSIGDDQAQGAGPSRVIGSTVTARLLGQDGDVVWLLIGAEPIALRAADGSILVDAARLLQRNPELENLLPTEAKYYGFDRGLLLTAADARQFVIRGPGYRAIPYVPPAPAPAAVPVKANGTPEVVPMLPLGDVPARQVRLQGALLGVYSAKEAADAANDDWGKNLRWPYNVLNEGKQTRRSFWRVRVTTTRRYDERYERIAEMQPIAEAPTLLNGRFAKEPGGDAKVLHDPESVLVWHSTRIDAAGRLALSRLDARLRTLWRVELPLSEPETFGLFDTWWLPGHLVVVGEQQELDDGVSRRTPYLVSVGTGNGAMRAASLVGVAE